MTSTLDKQVQIVTPRLKELSLRNSPKLHLSNTLLRQIVELHAEVGDIEWSGVLLFEETAGSIDDPSTFEITAQVVYPMNVGSEAYTEYEFSSNIIDIAETYPQYEDGEWRLAHIHSHHNMATFFSGTDMSELHDNTPNHHYYVSLIVNHKTKYCAKIAYIAEHASETTEWIDFKGRKIELNTPKVLERKLITMDCDIVIDYGNGQSFSDRVKQLIADKKERERVAATKVIPVWNKNGGQQKMHLPIGWPRPTTTYDNSWKQPEKQDLWDEELLNSSVYFPVQGAEEISDLEIEDFLKDLLGKGNQTAYFTLNAILDEQEMNVKKYVPNKLSFVAKFKKTFGKHFKGQEDEMDVVIDCSQTYLKEFRGYNVVDKYMTLLDAMYEEVD